MAVISSTIKRIAYIQHAVCVSVCVCMAHKNGFINIYELLLRV